MDLNCVSVHEHAKDNLANIQPSWSQTWSTTTTTTTTTQLYLYSIAHTYVMCTLFVRWVLRHPVDSHFFKKIVSFFILPYKFFIWSDLMAHFGHPLFKSRLNAWLCVLESMHHFKLSSPSCDSCFLWLVFTTVYAETNPSTQTFANSKGREERE